MRESSTVLAGKLPFLLVGIRAVFLESWSMSRGSSHSWFPFLPRWAAGDGVLAWITVWFRETEHQADELQFLVFSNASLCISFICRKWNGFICKENKSGWRFSWTPHASEKRWRVGTGFWLPSPHSRPLMCKVCKPRGFLLLQFHHYPLSFRWLCWEINTLDLMWLTFIGWSRWWGLWGFLIIHI